MIELDRVKAITKSLAFSNPSMNLNNSIDHLAFNNYWNTLQGYLTPAGVEILATISVHLTDVEVGYVVLALTRSMVAKRQGKLLEDGAKFLAQAVLRRAASTCSVAEAAMAESLAKSESSMAKAKSQEGMDVAEPYMDVQLQAKTPKDRTKLATTDGRIIDLTAIFKGR